MLYIIILWLHEYLYMFPVGEFIFVIYFLLTYHYASLYDMTDLAPVCVRS